MEMWVLIAAAGSGYLAHCWRLQKSKEAASDVSDDDNNYPSGLSSRIQSSRKRQTHLCRRVKVSSNQTSVVSEFGDNVGKSNDGHLHSSIGDDEETNGAQDMKDVAVLDASGSMTSSHFQTQLDAATTYPTDAESSTNSPRQFKYNTLCARQCGNFELFGQNCRGHECIAESFSDSLDCSTMTWDPAHFLRNFSMSGSRSILRDEYAVNLIDNVVENNVTNGGADVWLDDQLWASRYWNADKNTCVSETNTPVALQEHGGKRKARRFQKLGRQGHFTGENRSLEGCLPISSSDSCLSVYFGDDHNQEQTDGGVSVSPCGQHAFNGIGKYLGHELLEGTVSDNLLRNNNRVFLAYERTKGSRVLSERMNCESLVGEEAMENPRLPCLALQRKKRRWVNAWRECTPVGGNFALPGTGSANSLLKALLFNFGVGVGMMLTILSNKHCTKKVIRPFEETLHVLQSLQDEVRGGAKRMLECYQPKDTRGAAWADEQISALFEVVTRMLDVVEHLKILVSRDLACSSSMDDKLSKARAKLEAELEAELERMERNLNMEDASDFSCSYQDDLSIGNLVHGELSAIGIPNDAEVSSGSNDSGDSCYEVIHNGVPALELAKRLRDLLVEKQEEEILELQAKVEGLDRRLQAKQVELQAWKQWALHVEPPEKVLPSHRRVEPCCCTEGLCFFHARVSPLIRRCFNDEADDDFEEISHVSCETVTGPSSMLSNGLFIGAHGKGDQKSRGIIGHQEVKARGYISDATNASLDSSVECLDGQQTILHDHLQDKLEHKIGAKESRRKKCLNSNGKGKVVPVSEASCNLTQYKHAECAEGIRKLCESQREFRHHSLDWGTSEESSSYSSDLDEGQLLIKRIVEKGKRASSIVEVAQSVMASFDCDDACSTTESLSVL